MKTLEKPAVETPAAVAEGVEIVKVNKERPPVIPSPRQEGVTGRKPIRCKMHVGKDFIRTFSIPQMDSRKRATLVYHLYPTLLEWVGRILPDGVNPRSHDPECLKSPVAKKIEQTIIDKPEDFYLANRGSTIIAEEVNFDAKTGEVEIVIVDTDNQGLADGATTDAVLAKVQTQMARELTDNKGANYAEWLESIKNNNKIDMSKVPEVLRNGRIHLEVFVGLDGRERIANLVEGRNTSRQVKGWSMADFKQEFDWLKEVIDAEKSPFAGKIGYEENSGKPLTVLDVLSILTLFHPEFDQKDEMGKDKAPVVAYANKGRMDKRLEDETLRAGYKKLAPLIPDILQLHDYVYAGFEAAYEAAFGQKARLGKRDGVKSYLMGQPLELELTGLKSNYLIPSGFIFPLLASFRALVVYRGDKTAWKLDPFAFWDQHGKELVMELMEQVEGQGGNPNVAGKKKLVYTALNNKAKIALNDALEERRAAKANGK